jgi:hypothetical protein
VIDMVEGGDDAYGYIESKRLPLEHKLAFWGLLPSHTRSALKKAQHAAAVKPLLTAGDLGSQP